MAPAERRPTLKEIHENHERSAKNIAEKNEAPANYRASQTEILLEEMASSFGTSLEQAYLNPYNGAKLVRLTRPILLTHKNTGEKSVLAMQMTRFSLFTIDFNKAVEIYKENAKLPANTSSNRVMERIEAEVKEIYGKDWDSLREVTDNNYVPHLTLGRSRKKFYFAVYKLGLGSPRMKELEPFTIHDVRSSERRTPDIYITFEREPMFFKGQFRQDPDEPDKLRISFPRINQIHNQALDSALRLHPVRYNDADPFRLVNAVNESSLRELDFRFPSELAMGLIQSYLRTVTTGKSL